MKTIFVSSTFKDMHFERDAIHETVTPALNAVARQYGESVSFCDLRWGVNTGDLESDEGSRKVLSVCLNEIDRCRPYMLVMLGERYGWIPDASLISDAAGRAHMELDDLEKSVTALEIEYGALKNPEQLERTLFYFREIEGEAPDLYHAEDARHAEKLEQLKARVRKATGGRVKFYTLKWEGEGFSGLENFAQMVTGDVRSLMEQEWRDYAALSPLERENRAHWEYARQKSRQFAGRHDLISGYRKRLETEKCFAIQGAAGSGKSTLMSELAFRLSEQGYAVLPIFCGLTRQSNDVLDIIKIIVNYIEGNCGLESAPIDGGVKEWRERLHEVVAVWNGKKDQKLVILVDALDQLFDDEDRERLRFIPANLSDKVQMVVSCLDGFRLGQPMPVLPVEPLNETNKAEVIGGILQSMGRELEQKVVRAIMAKPSSDNPLYLSLILQRLTMMDKHDFDAITAAGDGMAAITAHQLEIVAGCSDELAGLCVDLVNAASARLGGDMARAALGYLAVSRHGLRESDLEQIMSTKGVPFNALDFARFTNYLSTFFLLRDDGRYDFTHRTIREGLQAITDNTTELHRELLAHFRTLDPHDPVRVGEITYHCVKADDKQYFVDYVKSFEDDKPVISAAARDVHDLALEDEGRWLLDLLRNAEIQNGAIELLCFIGNDLDRAFQHTQRELLIQKAVMLELAVLAEYLQSETDEPGEIGYNPRVCYRRLAEIEQALGATENLANALRYCEKSLCAAEMLMRQQDTAENRITVSEACLQMGGVYQALGGAENFTKAMELYQKAFVLCARILSESTDIVCQIEACICCDRMGRLYHILGGVQNLQMALCIYKNMLAMEENLSHVLSADDRRIDLAVGYEKVGDIYAEVGSAESLATALELYQKSLQLREQRARDRGTPDNYWALSVSYHKIGKVLEQMNGASDIQAALTYYQKDLQLSEFLYRTLQTCESGRYLSISYNEIGDIYRKQGGDENLKRAFGFYRKSLELRERLYAETGTRDSRRNLSVSYEKVGDIYKAIGDPAALEEALKLYQRSRELRELAVQDTGTAESRRDLAMIVSRLGEIYELRGGKENLARALQLYYSGLEMMQQLFREEGTAALCDDLAVLHYRIAGHPDTDTAERRAQLECFSALSGLLYAQTQSERHKSFMEAARQELAKLPPESTGS